MEAGVPGKAYDFILGIVTGGITNHLKKTFWPHIFVGVKI
jgi:hypothetical protein